MLGLLHGGSAVFPARKLGDGLEQSARLIGQVGPQLFRLFASLGFNQLPGTEDVLPQTVHLFDSHGIGDGIPPLVIADTADVQIIEGLCAQSQPDTPVDILGGDTFDKLQVVLQNQAAADGLVPGARGPKPLPGHFLQCQFFCPDPSRKVTGILMIHIDLTIIKGKHIGRSHSYLFCKLGKQAVRRITVIAIQKQDILTACHSHSGISGRGGPAVFLVDHPHTVIPVGICIADGSTIIGTAVVHQDQLKISKALMEDAVARL